MWTILRRLWRSWFGYPRREFTIQRRRVDGVTYYEPKR